MYRNLAVQVDQKTWPGPGIRPLYPLKFPRSPSSYELHIPSMLMMIGYLTTPTSSTGVSLSEFWAWVRYLAAISENPNLSLTRSFATLDAHQKTILSDDFGMGVPLVWLCDKLSLTQIVDGRYFMEKFSASVSATQKRSAKRGPNKTPDFVARDIAGRWNVIECKGTQSGSEFSRKQLGDRGPPATGGIAQKRSIVFPPNHTGQRLVCGLSIDVELDNGGSVLKIIDPEPEEPFEVFSDQLDYADDAINRGVMSKALRLAGFEVTAEAVASPFGANPRDTPSSRKAQERSRLAMVEERDRRSRSELVDDSDQTKFDGDYRGRRLILELPRAIVMNEITVKKVVIEQGVNEMALAELEARPTFEEPAVRENVDWSRLIDRTKTKITPDGPTATMDIGQVFRSKISFE